MKKRILAMILASCMMISLIPAAAAQEEVVTVTVPGVQQYSMAKNLFQVLNLRREEQGLAPLVCCYSLTQLAIQRAAEIALYADHVRPDGSDWSTVWTDDGSDCSVLAENIALGYGQADSVMNGWAASEASSANLFGTEYTEVGVACLQVGDIYCWVQVFGSGSDQGESSYTKTGYDETQIDVPVLPSNLVPVRENVYVEMPNGFSVRMDVTAYENLAAGKGWHLNLIPETNNVLAEDGTLIAKTNVYPGGSGKINFKTRRAGIGTAAFPVYEGQPDPVILTVNCGAFDKPQIPEREAPTASESPYAHVHTLELMNVVEGTCSSEGYTGDLTCTECLEVLDQGGAYKTEHTWGHWEVTGWPCWPANGGGKKCACTVCGEALFTGTTAREDPHPDGYPITVTCNMNCTIYQSITTAVEGHDIFLDVHHEKNYYIKSITVTSDALTEPQQGTGYLVHRDNSIGHFTMPAGAASVHVELAPRPTHDVILNVGEGGTASVNPAQAYEYDSTILTVTPDEGYLISSISILSHGTYVPNYEYLGDTRWLVDFPDGDLEIFVRFLPSENPFVDVAETDFFYLPVLWAYHNGITTGTNANHFSPAAVCNRAQIVTFLWRTAGSPEPVGRENPFLDVKETNYYYKAVLWAVENGITTGTDATHFSPSAICNRAQAVTFLWRACGQQEPIDPTHPFVDVEESAFYYDAMLWAVNYGITNGLDNYHFGPSVSCNRAQIVTFLYRTFSV